MVDNWKFYEEVDFADEGILQYHIDTRDFHCLANKEQSDKLPDMDKIGKYPDRFFFTGSEVKELIDRYYTDSGGKKSWRFFSLKGRGDWFKYIRIYRNGQHLVVCDREHIALTKEVLNSTVNIEH